MNQLQRIILINSGNVDFYELFLDGNIHFIGTQGTGKSTLLRAILFFYNADSRKLGISKEKKPFAEYYFPHADSYIIYEVKQGEHRFCVWLYKKQNRLCFRFIEGPYTQDLVLNKREALSESDLIAKAAEKGLKVHRPIFNFTEYRDIIYGANRSMRRFSIIENQNYHNIPRTISNIFLNSSLDGGFIKKTIINSLSDDAFEINLDKNRRHLESARQNYKDVSEYLKHEKKAQNIVSAYEVLLKQEKEQKDLAWKIGAAYNKGKEEYRLTEEKEGGLKIELQEQKTKIEKIKSDHKKRIRLDQDKLSNVKRDIVKANSLVKEYDAKNITTVLHEKNNEEQYQSDLSQINAQLGVLKSGSQEVENQYQLNKQKLENEWQQRILKSEASKQAELELLSKTMTDGQTSFYKEKEEVSQSYQVKIEEQEKEKTTIADALRSIDFEIEKLELQHFFQKEVEELKQQEQKLILDKEKASNKAKEAELQKLALQKEGLQQSQMLALEKTQESKEFETQKNELKAKISTLQDDIDALSGSLLEFLESNKSDWKSNIAKVVKKDILLRNDLKPSLELGDNLYGLSVELDDVESLQLSKQELERELSEKQKDLEALQLQILKFNDLHQAKNDKLQKKFNKKIAALKLDIVTFNSEKEQLSIAIEKNILAQKGLSEKGKAAKRQAIAEQELLRHKHQKKKDEVEAYLSTLNSEKSKLLDELTKRYKAQEKGVRQKKSALATEILDKKEGIQSELKLQLERLLKQRNDALAEKGADIEHINSLEAQAKALLAKLEYIKNNLELIIRYKKDCEDYIDRLDDFRRERKSYENDISHKNHLHDNKVKSENEIRDLLQKKVNASADLLKELGVQLDKYKRFASGLLFEKYRSFVEHHDVQDSWNCDVLIDKINNVALEYDKNDKQFSERITEFAGYFSPDNKLGFNTMLSSHALYRVFAENLKEFVLNQKIIDFKTDVTKKYAMILQNIVAETRDLLENEQAVYKIITRINSDFKNSNFVGVVKSIEMRLQDSSNKIMLILRKIRDFESENALNFGEINLFNQVESAKNNDEAVGLLESLLTQIGLAKSNTLTLENAFDLEFRICENENDTNWVSRLANVGSNGTDVLVKSMIYINLLHIFKNAGKKQKNDTVLHCLIDEVGILHDSNVSGLIDFAGERNIRLINGSPNSHNEQDYKHIYMFRKNQKTNKTGITKLISNEL